MSAEKYVWSSREIEVLISLWEKEDVLYNTQCVDYFKRDKRVDALERISDTLKISIPELRKKMTNLRTYYAKELWKVRKNETEGEQSSKPYSSRWIFFKPLNFLRDNCNPRHKGDEGDSLVVYATDEDGNESAEWDDSNIIASLTNAVNGIKDDSKDTESEEVMEDSLNERPDLTGNSPVSMVQINNTHHDSPKILERNTRKRTGEDLENVIAKLRRTKPDSKPSTRSPPVPRIDLTSSNPDMVFAHHVGLTLMNIGDSKLKDLAKLKIQQVLFETQYGNDTMQSVEVQVYPVAN